MAKDPAFLFYSDNFMSGTMFFTDEQTGKYIRLLCAQHLTGHLDEKHMIHICKTYDKDIWSKFSVDADGRYYNDRLEQEIVKRQNYSESRRKNRKVVNNEDVNKKDMNNISSTYDPSYDNHMGNGNGNGNEDEILKGVQGEKQKPIKYPTEIEMIEYFAENGYSEAHAKKVFHYYSSADWHDSSGKLVRAWKQKVIANWFKDEGKIKPSERKFVA